jgi:hypothetical protein
VPVGRPTTFTPDLGLALARGIFEGASLYGVAAAHGVPAKTAIRWLEDQPEFRRWVSLAFFASSTAIQLAHGDRVPPHLIAESDRIRDALYCPYPERRVDLLAEIRDRVPLFERDLGWSWVLVHGPAAVYDAVRRRREAPKPLEPA